ncbi:5'-adenylylsulfate reductase-like 4 [Camellia lanceoleosa]|uniref:5'-adenylylsulfate reductase-like 4 n=1 Tax=Camellia lanceoleosa TaxID=1840588 RepID=A0ACC0IFA3_9ERIC|nr:5'-adenylylsulfate reductase-like 4 [Camellia lanceoleosa]
MIRHRVQQFLNLLSLVGVIVLQNTQNIISGGGDCSGRLTTAQLLLYEAKHGLIGNPSFLRLGLGDEVSLQRALSLVHKNIHNYVAVLFYASWCPFSGAFIPTFSILSTLYPSIPHFAIKESVIRPSYGYNGHVREMVPAWPLRFHHQTPIGSSKAGGETSTDSGSAVNTLPSKVEAHLEPESPMSRKASSDHQSFDPRNAQMPQQQQQQQQQQQLEMASDGPRTGLSESQQAAKHTPEKRKGPGGSTSERALDFSFVGH